MNVNAEGEWEAVSGHVDSVAAATICGKDVAEDYQAHKMSKARMVVDYMSASDDPMYDLGERRIVGIGEYWTQVDMVSQLGELNGGVSNCSSGIVGQRQPGCMLRQWELH